MTAHAFQCPTCGAPLTPRASAVIRCTYCQASVVVPETLRRAAGTGGWRTLVYDGFTGGDHAWLVGDQAGEYFPVLSRAIRDGRYRWEARTGLPSSISPAWLPGYSLEDFHLSVSCKHVLGSRAGSACGPLFRVQDNQNGFCFRVAGTQSFSVTVQEGGRWSVLLDWTRAHCIKPGGVNHLEVVAQQGLFTFHINGEEVHALEDRRFERGMVGLAVEGYTPGEDIVYDFLDVTLRAP